MELDDTLRIPLAQSDVWEAMQDPTLLRASLDHCETFNRLGLREYALTLTVPLGPLRARYDVRAHVAGHDPSPAGPLRRTLNFKARAEGIGSLRGQIDVTLREDDHAQRVSNPRGTRIGYSIWAALAGPLAQLPARQIENELRELANDFFTEFCAVVQAKHGLGPNRANGAAVRRQHVFLRPIGLAGMARRARAHDHGGARSGRVASTLSGARVAHGVPHREPNPHAVPNWAWAAMILLVALLMYVVHWLSEG